MIRVLIIDDSAFSRRTIKSMLESSGEIKVAGIATDGDEGLRMTESLQPDVITLDLEMPRMDGFSFLRILTYRRPRPVIVVSSHARRVDVLRSLDLGALDFVAKPTKIASKTLWNIRDELVAKVLEAASARMDLYLMDLHPDQVTGLHSIDALENVETDTRPISIHPLSPPPPSLERRPPSSFSKNPFVEPGTEGVLLVGASTGGPKALRKLLSSLMPDCPWPVVIAQHMPARFTNEFAARLARKLELDVLEAGEGSSLAPGRILIAPGGFHLTLALSNDNARPMVKLHTSSKRDRHVPSIDRMFESAPSVFGSNVIAVILTGMGEDGSKGAETIRKAGGKIIAEDRSTAVVFGMPHRAIQKGVVDTIAPLDSISSSIRWYISRIRQKGDPSAG